MTDEQTDLLRVTGAYPLDVDSDGVADLAVLRYGENVLLRGLGDCRFERANEAWGFDGGGEWTTAFFFNSSAVLTVAGSVAFPPVALGNVTFRSFVAISLTSGLSFLSSAAASGARASSASARVVRMGVSRISESLGYLPAATTLTSASLGTT